MAEQLWTSCKQQLKSILGETSFNTWIAPLAVKKISNQSLILEAPDAFFKNWLETNYLVQIQQALKETAQKSFEVTF